MPYLRHKAGAIWSLFGTQREQRRLRERSVGFRVPSRAVCVPAPSMSGSRVGIARTGLSTVGGEMELRIVRFQVGGESGDSRTSAGGVPVSSVQKSSVPVRSFDGVRCVSKRSAFPASASVLRQSPRNALAPAFEALRRAAEVNKCQRIARRLAGFAGGRQRQRSWSSAKSLRGVC